MTNSNKINIKAILIGVLVHNIAGLILAIILAAVLISQGVPVAQLTQNLLLLVIFTILDLGFTFLGGFVSARIAKSAEIMHSSIIGVISVVLGVLFYHPGSDYYFWCCLIGFLLYVPIAILGGYVAQGRNRKQSLLNTNEKSTKRLNVLHYHKQRKLPRSLTIVASYLIIAGIIGLVGMLLTLTDWVPNYAEFQAQYAEFQAQSLGYRLGEQFRVIVFDLLYLVAGIGLFLRKPWAYKFALITIFVSTFFSVKEFAWGFAGGKPPHKKVYVLATIVTVLWKGFWIYLLYRGKAAVALQSKNEMGG